MRELEIAGLAAADGLVGPRAAAPGEGPKHAAAHTECLNCGAPLHGKYCYACGQTSDDHHRSIFHLIWEAVEGLTHLDGRLARTLPPLFLRPGKLARDHFEGRRQRHVPPFRLFLISLLLFMFSLEVTTHHKADHAPGVSSSTDHATGITTSTARAPNGVTTVTQKQPDGASKVTVSGLPKGMRITTTDKGSSVNFGGGLVAVGGGAAPHQPTAAESESGFDEMSKSKKPIVRWFAERGRKAMANREYFRSIMFEWGHRLAIVLLPIFAGLLTLAYCYRRQFYVYDHLVVAMHFLSFTFLIWALVYIVPDPVRGVLMLIATIWTPINLFMTLRGAYGSSIAGAVGKTGVLWIVTLFLFLALLMGVVVLALGSV